MEPTEFQAETRKHVADLHGANIDLDVAVASVIAVDSNTKRVRVLEALDLT